MTLYVIYSLCVVFPLEETEVFSRWLEGQEGKQGGKDRDWNKRWGDQSAPRLQDKGLGSMCPSQPVLLGPEQARLSLLGFACASEVTFRNPFFSSLPPPPIAAPSPPTAILSGKTGNACAQETGTTLIEQKGESSGLLHLPGQPRGWTGLR